MPVVLTQQVPITERETRPIIADEAFDEFMVFCPKCGTLEMLCCTEDGLLVPTRKFRQYGTRIYHDCGAGTPCRLYRTS